MICDSVNYFERNYQQREKKEYEENKLGMKKKFSLFIVYKSAMHDVGFSTKTFSHSS